MHSESRKKLVKIVYRMLLELSNGNLSYRIELHNQDKQFEEIVKSLNTVAEKMQTANYLNPYFIPSLVLSCDDSTTLLVNQVREYILSHLDEPLPSARELSKMYGTNEFALKNSFRKLLNTSIYQFYTDERLKKAHFLIAYSAIQLKEISFICGFNDYTNFFKAFKKKYRYTPRDVVRVQPADSSE